MPSVFAVEHEGVRVGPYFRTAQARDAFLGTIPGGCDMDTVEHCDACPEMLAAAVDGVAKRKPLRRLGKVGF